MKKTFSALASVVLLWISLISCAANNAINQQQVDNQAIISNYEELTDSLISGNKVPGLIVGVWAPDRNLVWIKAKGKANTATGETMKDYHRFRMGSITKTVTYTVLLQLVDETLLSLEDKLSTYFPDFPNADKVTIRMICNHTSGIFNYNQTTLYTDQISANPLKIWNPQEFLDIAKSQPYSFPPGTSYEYSNTNTIMAGMIIEKITGHSVAYEIKKRIIEKLNLNNTYYPDDNLFWGQHSHGYGGWSESDPTADVTEAFDPSCVGAAGAIISDIYDLKTWIEAAVKGTLLSAGMQAQRLTPVSSTDIFSYGLGLGSIKTSNGSYVWGHDGQVYGYRSIAYHWPVKNVTIVISFNTATADPSLLMGQMFRKLNEYP